MPVKILEQIYSNQFKPPSTTSWLLGNVGDIQKLTLDCRFAVEKLFTVFDTLTLTDPNLMILNSGENWRDLGFDVGMDISFEFTVVSGNVSIFAPFQLKITGILGNEAEVTLQNGAPVGTWGTAVNTPLPLNDATGQMNNVIIFANISDGNLR